SRKRNSNEGGQTCLIAETILAAAALPCCGHQLDCPLFSASGGMTGKWLAINAQYLSGSTECSATRSSEQSSEKSPALADVTGPSLLNSSNQRAASSALEYSLGSSSMTSQPNTVAMSRMHSARCSRVPLAFFSHTSRRSPSVRSIRSSPRSTSTWPNCLQMLSERFTPKTSSVPSLVFVTPSVYSKYAPLSVSKMRPQPPSMFVD